MRSSYRAVPVTLTVLASLALGLPVASVAATSSRPVISSMSPASGGTSANVVAVLHGRDLTHVTSVYFGRERARFRMVSSTVLRAAAPKTSTTHYAGVRVVTRAGTSNTRNFLYVAPPTVTALSSHVASSAGGKRITVTGTNFRSVRAVAFGGVHGRDVHVLSTRKLLVTTPPHTSSDLTVGVITAYGSSVRRVPQSAFVFQDLPVVNGLSVADGPVDGGRRVVIRGTGLTAARSVLFGGRAATVVDRYGSGIVVTAPAHPAGSVDVVVSTAVGTSPVTPSVRFRYGPANALSWSGPKIIDPVRSGLDALSCSGTLCAAIDRRGGLFVKDGAGWREADPTSTRPWAAVFCGASAFCSATDDQGWESHYSAGVWSTPAWSWSAAARVMSCASATSCFAFTTTGHEMVWNGSAWTELATRIYNAVALTCPDSNECLAVSSDGSAPTRTGDFWTFGSRAAPTALNAAACDPAGTCLVADRNGNWYAHDAGTSGWHGLAGGPTPAGAVGHNLTCTSPAYCVLTSRNAAGDLVLVPYEDGAWQPAVVAPSLMTTVPSCGAARQCTVSSYADTYTSVQTFDGTSFGAPESVDPDRGWISELSCSSDTFCVAVDADGNAVASGADGSWSPPTRVAANLSEVSCGADGHCVAISRHTIFSLDDGAWTAVVDDPDTTFVDASCVDASYCVVVDAAGGARESSGGVWGAPMKVAVPSLAGVSCSDVGECTAIAGTRSVVTMSKGTWGTPRALATSGPGLMSIDCPTSRTCFVGRSDGSLVRVRGAEVTSYANVLPDYVRDLSCASETFCVAVDGANTSGVTWDGSFWSVSAPVGDYATRAVSCTAHRCVAADAQSVYTAAR